MIWQVIAGVAGGIFAAFVACCLWAMATASTYID